MTSLKPFYFDDGAGHAVKIRRWLPWGHPERIVVARS
jgi:hypothetical protein